MTNSRKRLIWVLVVLLVVLLAGGVFYLLRRSNFLADELSTCDNTYPYYIETGKQDVPGNFLVSIDPAQSQKWLGSKPDSNYGVCSATGHLSSYVDPSGRIWFEPGTTIAANSKAVFFIQKSVSSLVSPLFSSSDLASFPFNNNVSANGSTGGWQIKTNNPDVKFSQSYSTVANPGDSDTFDLKISAPGSGDPNDANPTIQLISDWLPIAKDQTNIFSGWIKTANIKLPDLNSNSTSKNGSRRIAIGYEVEHTIPSAVGTYKAGDKVTSNPVFYSINNENNVDWDEILSSYTDYSASSTVSNKATNNQIVDCDQNRARIVINITNITGEIQLGDFKVIKNVPIEDSEQDPNSSDSQNGDQNDSSTQTAWVPSYFGHYGDIDTTPQKQVLLDGQPFTYNDQTQFFYTNNFADYYKDHTDGSDIVLTSALNDALDKTINFSPISSYDPSKPSVIIGDLANADFKNFISANFPSVLSSGEFKPQGYTLFSSQNTIIVAGSDMAGSYYGTLRLADLLKTGSTIASQMEIDYPDISLRAWLYNLKSGINSTLSTQEADIKQASRERFNAYMIYNISDFFYMNSEPTTVAAYQKLFTYAKIYFVDPIPEFTSYNYASRNIIGSTRQVPPPGNINRVYVSENITFADNTNTGTNFGVQFGRLVQREYTGSDDKTVIGKIPLTVTSTDGTTTYSESTNGTDGDYIIQVKNAAGEYVASNEDDLGYQAATSTTPARDDYNAMYEVKRTAASKIPATGTVKIKFNGIPKFTSATLDDGSSLPPALVKKIPVRLNSQTYLTFAETAIQNAINYFHPDYIHLNNGELFGIGLDYRDLYNPDGSKKSGNSSAEILANQINTLSNYTQSTSSGATKMIVWSDNLDPFFKPGANYLGNAYPYPHAALSSLTTNVVLDSWNYFTSKDACQNVTSFANLVVPKNINLILSPSLYSLEPEENWRCLAALSKSINQNTSGGQIIGWITPDWSTSRQDATEAPLLSSIEWNNSNQTQVVDDRDHTPPVISDINIQNGQTITTTPFTIRAKVTDNVAVAKVNFYAGDNLIGATTLPDLSSYYQVSFDASQYVGKSVDIKIVATDTAGNSSQAIVKINIASSPSPVVTPTELPRTGTGQ